MKGVLCDSIGLLCLHLALAVAAKVWSQINHDLSHASAAQSDQNLLHSSIQINLLENRAVYMYVVTQNPLLLVFC